MNRYILMLMVLLGGTTVLASEDNTALIKRLEDKGEYRLAAEMLVENLSTSGAHTTYRQLLEFANRTLIKLSAEATRKNISIFTPPDKDGCWKRNVKNSGTSTLVALADVLLGGWGSYSTYYQTWLNKKATDKQRDAVRQIENNLPSIDNAQQILQDYDSVKLVVVCLEKKCKAEIKKNPADLDVMLSVLNEIRALKKKLKNDRTIFLSYNVISPYLWEAERQMFLADSDYLALQFKNKRTLDHAVNVLAKACHKEWLYQASEDVRMQFTGTQRVLKQIASKTELEDYKVVTTLADSLDPSKKRGADAWLE